MTTTNTSNPPTPTPTAPLTRSEQFITAAVFLFPALALTVPDGYSIGAVALLIAAITHLVANRRTWAQHPPLPGAVKAVIAFMILYALFWMGDAALRGEGVREFDRPSRFLLAAFCLSVFARARIQQGALWLGLAVGGIGAGGLAITQKLIEGQQRANGFAQVIQFGNAAMLIGLMCLAGMLWSLQPPTTNPDRLRRTRRRRVLLTLLMGLGALGGLTASFVSGTRGAWLALGPALLVGLWAAVQLRKARLYLLIGPFALAVIVTTAYFIPATGVEWRVDSAVNEVHLYLEDTERRTNTGNRFEMWRGAAHLISERPWVGWGETGYQAGLARLGEAGIITERAAEYTHAHNEWLNVWAKRGIIGIFILLGLYLSPINAFVRSPRGATSQTSSSGSHESPHLALHTAGMMFTLGAMATGLTQVNFNHNIGVMTFAFMTAVLVGISQRN
ncbi:O-antigen ligase family protein [Spiribacter roseus]|uniref:O-antigen ligase family protein n=1 Tax=Spiribacter roseus TaxID=1855875 RepID=UPI0012FDD497